MDDRQGDRQHEQHGHQERPRCADAPDHDGEGNQRHEQQPAEVGSGQGEHPQPRQRVEADPLRGGRKADEDADERQGPPGAARPSAGPDLPEDQVGRHDEDRHEDVVHRDAAHDVAHAVDRNEGRREDGDPAPAEHRRREQVDEADEDGPEDDAGKAPGERVAARVDADQRAVARADEQPAVVVALAVGARVEAHRQGRAGQRGRVEGGEAGARVAANVEVRLDRPDHRLALGRHAGHVDDVRDHLAADERRGAGERHDVGDALDVGIEGGEAAGRRRVLVVCRQRSGQREQLLVVAAATRQQGPDERRVDRHDALLLAVVVDVELERRGVDEHDRVASRVGGRDEAAALAGRLHVRDATVRALGRATDLVGGAVRDRNAIGAAEEQHAALARDVDLADRREAGDDGGPGRRRAAVGRREEAGQLVGVDRAGVGASDQQARRVAVVGEAGDRSRRVPAGDLVTGLGVACQDRRPAGRRGEGDRSVPAHRRSLGGDRDRRRRRIERRAADDLVRIGHHDAGRDEVLGQHRVRPLVDVAVPAVLPVGEPLHAGSSVVDLVEVVAARDVEAPQPEDEGEQDEPEHDERVAPVEPPARLAQVGVGGVAGQPRQERAAGRPLGWGLRSRRPLIRARRWGACAPASAPAPARCRRPAVAARARRPCRARGPP